METITKILKPDKGIELGAEIIKQGGLVAFPTETVYGLGGNALNSDTIKNIYEAKGRPSDNPLIVHLADINDITPLVKEFSEGNRAVAEAFMPGPITLLFPRGDAIPQVVTAGRDTVAIRIPKNPIAREFIRRAGVPIAAPSANRSTHISPTSAEHVYEDLKGRIPLIIDGGACEVGIESTVLDLTGDIPTILRPGAVTAEMLLTVIDKVKSFTGEVLSSAPAPGMKYKHYAPQVDMAVSDDIVKLVKKYDDLALKGLSPILLIGNEYLSIVGSRRHIDLGVSMTDICKNIYASLHAAEHESDYILCYDFGREGLGGSIMNRVLKAASNNVLE